MALWFFASADAAIDGERIGPGGAIKNSIERPLNAIWIAVFAGLDESLSVSRCLVFDEDDYLLFRSRIKELATQWCHFFISSPLPPRGL